MRSGGAIWALGTMSGTSLDGVDAAMVLTDGERILEFGPTAFRPYTLPNNPPCAPPLAAGRAKTA